MPKIEGGNSCAKEIDLEFCVWNNSMRGRSQRARTSRISRLIAEIDEVRSTAKSLLENNQADSALRLYESLAETYKSTAAESNGASRSRLLDCLAGAYFGISRCLAQQGSIQESIEYCEKSEELRCSLDNSKGREKSSGIGNRRAWVLHKLASTYTGLGQIAEAVESYRKCVRLYRAEALAQRLTKELVHDWAIACKSLALLLKDNDPAQAKQVLTEFGVAWAACGHPLDDEKLSVEIESLRLSLQVKIDSDNSKSIAASHKAATAMKKIGSQLHLTTLFVGVWMVYLLRMGIFGISEYGVFPALAVMLLTGMSYLMFGGRLTRKALRADIAAAVATSGVTLACIAITNGFSIGMLVVLLAQIGGAFLGDRAYHCRFLQRWRERHMLHARAIQDDFGKAKRIAEMLPSAIRWLIIQSNDGHDQFRPYVAHISAEVVLVREFSLWIGELVSEWVGVSLGQGFRPPPQRFHRPERNLSQPWAGHRVFFALLPRGVHASAV